MVLLNLDGKREVDELYDYWQEARAEDPCGAGG
jgi:hypothetical protein